MQLHLQEHRDITDCLQRAGRLADVQMIKRKGWIFLKIGDQSFAFHRKKVTRIENGKFVEGSEYYVNYPQKPVKVEGWMQVIERLQQWLKQLPDRD